MLFPAFRKQKVGSKQQNEDQDTGQIEGNGISDLCDLQKAFQKHGDAGRQDQSHNTGSDAGQESLCHQRQGQKLIKKQGNQVDNQKGRNADSNGSSQCACKTTHLLTKISSTVDCHGAGVDFEIAVMVRKSSLEIHFLRMTNSFSRRASMA